MIYSFKGIRAQQTLDHDVFAFAATAEQILSMADIERVGRDPQGLLQGFQRHQVAAHIKEIRHYLARSDALLPNAIILAFLDGVTVTPISDGVVDIQVDIGQGKCGFVVDGQQRLTALSSLEKPDFQVFVSAVICKNYNELRQQFVLINNTRPLPKSLIYELLPTVTGLPERFTARKFAAQVVDLLNCMPDSSLHGEIRQHTNPTGVISDLAMQKLVMNSVNDGSLRHFLKFEDAADRAVALIHTFFKAVIQVFQHEWIGMSPRHSRLKHGAGIVALGYVMEELHHQGAVTCQDFVDGLQKIKPFTAWTSGEWVFAANDRRPWNGIQNTPTDIAMLSRFLLHTLKQHSQPSA